MSDHYTAEDMKAVSEALIEMQGAHHVLTPKAILDAVAPAIAARALRDAVAVMRRHWANDGVYVHPTDAETWGTADVWMEWHADEIEAS